MIARRWLNTTAALIVLLGGAELLRPEPVLAAQDGYCTACGPLFEECEWAGDQLCRPLCGSIFYAVGCYHTEVSTCVECTS